MVRTGTPVRRASCPIVSRGLSAMRSILELSSGWKVKADSAARARLDRVGDGTATLDYVVDTVATLLDQRPAVLLAAALALLAVVWSASWRWTRTVVTIAHEGGHALVAVLAGPRPHRHPAARRHLGADRLHRRPPRAGAGVHVPRRLPGAVVARDRRRAAGRRRPRRADAVDRDRPARGHAGARPQRLRRVRRAGHRGAGRRPSRGGASRGCRTGSRRRCAGSCCSGACGRYASCSARAAGGTARPTPTCSARSRGSRGECGCCSSGCSAAAAVIVAAGILLFT